MLEFVGVGVCGLVEGSRGRLYSLVFKLEVVELGGIYS